MSPRKTDQELAIISAPLSKAYVGEEYVYQILTEHDDESSLSYALIQSPAGMKINAESGKVSWRPDASQDGVHYVEVHVSDGHAVVRQLYYIIIRPSGPGAVSLADLVQCLQILVGLEADIIVNEGSDLTDDQRIGMDDIIYMLRVAADISSE